MAPTIKNVALAGAGGNVGPSLLKALMDSNKFNITILTRKAGSQNFPAGVTVKEVDYDSLDSLTQALQGQDALINSTNSFDPKVATRVVDAALAAGVYRYVPPDFGIDPLRAHVPELPVFGIKGMTHKYVQAKAGESGGKFSWTIVANGPFLDWGIRTAFMGVDVRKKKITYFNDGENVVPYTNLADVGRAVVGTLLDPAETANRIVYVHSTNKSQRQMAALAKEALGGEWEETTTDFDAVYAGCMESIKKGIMTPDVMYPQILYACSKKQYAQPWEKSDNALLGIKELSDDELKALFKSIASE
ncbi:isoflavone reductase [Colletotrichum plurivorum]|uniref:Isoflavone reductase n=1 Tax=Colletotrichum plurivorum TaxID=2175906 RepID=A0A8H6U6D3_9PEZI|nr:isoflavone reductase [Colletotrichum plurivorum]